MSRKISLRIIPLEERILLDAAIAAVIAHPIATPDAHPVATPESAAVTTQSQDSQVSTNIIYVNANAGGTVHDGKSWATAYTNLQSALQGASLTPGADQIWIATGTYVPSQIYSPDGVVGGASGLNDPHLKTFDVPTDTALYGGFKAGMTSLSQANPTLYPTILTGDLLGNDVNNTADPSYLASKADNAWHVVTLGNDVSQTGVNVSLNGLNIIDGYANGPAGTPTFSPFVYNHNFGGGIYASFDSTVLVKNNVLQYNYASSDGGGIFTNNTDLTVMNSSFLNNAAVTRGGGLESLNTFEGANPHTANIINSFFKDNSSTVFGGAIVGEGTFPNLQSVMNINNSTFVHNTSPEGGAIVFDSLTANINGSTFTNNIATVNGGAISTTNIVDSIVGGPNQFVTTINDSSFIHNISYGDPVAHEALNNFLGFPIGIDFARGGGALTSYITGHLVVNDSLFLNNVAQDGNGGAILNGFSSGNNVFGTGLTTDVATTAVSGSTFIGNVALHGDGGAVASASDHVLPDNPADLSLVVDNSNLVGNRASDNGGGIFVDTSLLSDHNNVFLLNQAANGDQLYGINSVANGIPTSSNTAYLNQILTNKFLLLDNDDLYLA